MIERRQGMIIGPGATLAKLEVLDGDINAVYLDKLAQAGELRFREEGAPAGKVTKPKAPEENEKPKKGGKGDSSGEKADSGK